MAWRCRQCGEAITGCTAPEACPSCGAPCEELELEREEAERRDEDDEW
ncbi:MAG: hypothetical protein QJR13_03745 [Bacillota bacterium]|nr:hypothetical protein [Bacillota bacterium]